LEGETELEEIWRTRLGMFAKVKYHSSSGENLSYGIVHKVVSGILIIHNKVKNTFTDIPISKIIDSEVSIDRGEKNV
jgi:hypothetical protein